MKSSLDTKSLAEVCLKITDGSHFSPKAVLSEFMMASSKDMTDHGWDYSDIKKISKEDYDRLVKSDCKPRLNDVLIIKDGNSYLQKVFTVKKEEQIVILSSIAILRPDPKKIDPIYLQYILKTNYIKEAASNFVTGAAIPRVILSDFKKVQIPYPALSDQKRIASILSKYDELIEVNIQRIKVLEEAAKELYKEWFVRQRFPKKWKINRIPNASFASLIAFTIGGGWGSEVKTSSEPNSVYVIRGTDFEKIQHGDFSSVPLRYESDTILKSRILKPGDIVLENSVNASSRCTGKSILITEAILSQFDAPVIPASFCKLVRPSNIELSHFIWLNLCLLYESGLMEYYQNVATNGIGNFQMNRFLEKHAVPYHEDIKTEIASTFSSFDSTLYKSKINCLTQIRDRLLPRLISGVPAVNSFENKAKVTSISSKSLALWKENDESKNHIFFTRRVLAAYIIDRLYQEITFGHVKLMKLMYLCEHLAEIETASHYHRYAAGPYDNNMIRSIDSQLKKAKWFEAKLENGKYNYYPLAKKDEYKSWFDKYFLEKQTGIDSLINLFGKERTEKVEMVATLYEAHRDIKSKKKIVTEKEVIHEVLNNWHESKKRIDEGRWKECLAWMQQKNWINMN